MDLAIARRAHCQTIEAELKEDVTMAQTIIPALSDWYVAIFIEGGKFNDEKRNDYFSLEPIIAWEIEREGETDADASHLVTPITFNGNMNAVGHVWGVKRPDNKFEVDGGTCDSETEALAVCNDVCRRRTSLKRQRT
jgi:hypothetical protein